MKKVAGNLRLYLAQYREMAAFAQFGSDLDKATQRLLTRGERLVELLKQKQYEPMPVERQIVLIYAGTNGYLDNYPVESVSKYEAQFLRFIDDKHPDIFQILREKKELTDELVKKLNAALEEFKGIFQP
jgi:F-type H+-transporting ATPase subunit alpha